MKVIVLFESENDGIWIDETEICGDFGLKRVKNRIRRMIMMKIMKIVATTHEAKFVLPDDLCCLFMVVEWVVVVLVVEWKLEEVKERREEFYGVLIFKGVSEKEVMPLYVF